MCKKDAFIIFFLTLSSLVNANTSNGVKLSELLTKATVLEEQKDYTNALEIYHEALRIASDKGLANDASFIYKKIGLIYYQQQQYNPSKKNFKNSISKEHTSKNAADSYFNLSLIYKKEKQRDSLLWALNNALIIYDMLEDSKDKFYTYSKAGILYKQASQYDNAIKCLISAYNGFTKLGNSEQKATVCGNIADIQRHLGNLDIAEEYYRQHLTLRTKLDDTLKLSFAHNNIANLFYETKRYDSAIIYYNYALVLQRQLKNKNNIGKTLSNLGMTYYQLKNFDNAYANYTEALVLKKETQDFNSIIQTLSELASISLDREKYAQAFGYIKESETYITPTTEKPTLLRHYGVFAKYYELTNNYEQAYKYQHLQFLLYKEVFNEEQSKTIQTLQEQFESQLKEQKISELSIKNEHNESTIQIQEQRLRNRNLFITLFAVIIIGVFFFIKQRQKNKLQLLENQKLEAILEGQEAIKEHISKDLHDIIATSYDAIRLKILALAKAKDPQILSKDIIEDIKNINHEIRLISHRLSPLGNRVKDSTLRDIVISQLSEFQHYGKIFVDVQLPLPEALDHMSLESQTNFYGIVLEVLSNIEKHAKATRVTIEHTLLRDGKIQFKICDNGIGFMKKNNNGIGLVNMQQRATLLGGNYTIESNEKGTCICLTFSITKNLK
jgi:signal transduction histidine kinase